MSALSQLQNGPFRPDRGGLPESLRQFEAVAIAARNRLRAAILELASAAGVTISGGSSTGSSGTAGRTCIESSFCIRPDAGDFFCPWAGSQSEALPGGVDEEVLLLPPFGANTRLVSVSFVCAVSMGNTNISICEADETVIETEAVASVVQDDVFTATFDYDWTDGATKTILVDPTVNPSRFRLVALFEEVAS